MIEQITTPNMLEIAYLLDRQHRIIAVDTANSWPYGINELSVTLEGDSIGLDRANFVRHGSISFAILSKAMDAVQLIIAQQMENQI